MAFGITSCRPGGRSSVTVPLGPPNCGDAVYISEIDAGVMPPLASVISVEECAPFCPTVSTMTGSIRVATNIRPRGRTTKAWKSLDHEGGLLQPAGAARVKPV